MVVSAQALASQVGVEVLRAGGNVVDAAVAVGYALAVVYPAAGNLGGGGFMTIRFADSRTTFLDFREKAPLAATPDMFLGPDGAVIPGLSTDSWKAVAVPGSVAGLEAARERYGSRPRAELIAPALALARDGFALTPGDATLIALVAPSLARDPAARAVFLPDGRPPRAGDVLRQPDLARTLERIAADGAPAVYGGPIGDAIVQAGADGGGVLAAEDFRRYAVREMRPVTCSYRGLVVHSAPPPSSGGVALCEILAIVEGYPLDAYGFRSAAEVNVLSESMRAAFRDRNDALGDPAFVDNPVARLTDKGYAASLRNAIAIGRAGPPSAAPDAERPQTTHYSVADAAGNAVAVTTTLNGWFGARRIAGATGIVMNNEMDDFTAKPGVPNMFGLVQGQNNAVAPGKTPLSSMAPTIVTRDGRLALVLGSPGGSRIITVVAETLVNMADHGMSLAEAVDAPRFHMQGQPDVLAVEPFGLSPDTAAVLTGEGYSVRTQAPWGMVAAIAAGSRRLRPRQDEGHALALQPDAPGAALFGAMDVRSPTGLAAGY